MNALILDTGLEHYLKLVISVCGTVIKPLSHDIPLDILFASATDPSVAFRSIRVLIGFEGRTFTKRVFCTLVFDKEHSRPTSANRIPVVHAVRIVPFAVFTGFFIAGEIGCLLNVSLKRVAIQLLSRVVGNNRDLLGRFCSLRMVERTSVSLIYFSIFNDEFVPLRSRILFHYASVREPHTINGCIIVTKRLTGAVVKLKKSLVFSAAVEALHNITNDRRNLTPECSADVVHAFVEDIQHHFLTNAAYVFRLRFSHLLDLVSHFFFPFRIGFDSRKIYS